MIEKQIKIGEKTYPLFIGNSLLYQMGCLLENQIKGRKVILLTDTNVEKHYGPLLLEKIGRYCSDIHLIIVPSGEENKSLGSYELIIEDLIKNQVNRSSLLIAVGGGIIGDLGAFVASTYMRGISLIHVPTTLLAQVDSSIGGKTGINYRGFKNLIGTFYHPVSIVIDLSTLKTLPSREYRAAYGEIIKYGILGDYHLLNRLWDHYDNYADKRENLEEVVLKCIEMKERIVAQDERDWGNRRLLNLGHTFGHAIESSTTFDVYLHGEAVALGLMIAVRLSWNLGMIKEDYYYFLKNILLKYYPRPIKDKLNEKTILKNMIMDKKNEEIGIAVVLPTAVEKAELFMDIPIEQIQRAIVEVNDEFSCT